MTLTEWKTRADALSDAEFTEFRRRIILHLPYHRFRFLSSEGPQQTPRQRSQTTEHDHGTI
jgi:hypothetical protein